MRLNTLLGQQPGALLFDLDGTLIDSVPDLASALDHCLVDAGLEPAGEAKVRAWVGNGARKLMERALLDACGSAAALDALLPEFFAAYEHCCTDKTAVYPGVQEALVRWHQAGIKFACVTNKPERFATRIIAHFAWDRMMPVVLGGDSLPRKKPQPEPLWEACQRLGVSHEKAIMVGDSVNDVRAARAAGMPVIAVPYGYNYGADIADSDPDLLVAALADLL